MPFYCFLTYLIKTYLYWIICFIYMEKTLLEIKPSITNALFPVFVKNFLVILIFSIFAFLIYYFNLIKINLTNTQVILYLLLINFILANIPLIWKMIKLSRTLYRFTDIGVYKIFNLFAIKEDFTPYNQIVNIDRITSVWDLLCKAGDIILHTTEDNQPDLKIQYVTNPSEIIASINRMILRFK